jgi:hypothetical protein
MFSSIMAGFMKGLSENDRKIMTDCREKMADLYPCLRLKDLSEEDKKAMQERMMSFCVGQMETLSTFFKERDPKTEQTGQSEKGV